jgi:hypothetical protein
MLTQTLSEQIVLLAKQMHEKGESSNHVNLPFYNGLVEERGNSYHKVLAPVTLQRNSAERAEGDIYRTFFLQKDDKGRYVLYNHDTANRGNMIVVPTSDFVDNFGNFIPAWTPMQMNGNTLIVALCKLLNGELDIPKDYLLSDCVPEEESTLRYEIVLFSGNGEYNRIYREIDHTASGKSKNDYYTSVLHGFHYLDATTGESNLTPWLLSDMDGPISLIDNNTVPKDAEPMAEVVKPYLSVFENVPAITSQIVNNGSTYSKIYRAFCVDMTAAYMNNKAPYFNEFLNQLVSEIQIIKDSNVEEYWQDKLFGRKKVRNGSTINWQGEKNFSSWIRNRAADVWKLRLTAVDWILWELFYIERDSGKYADVCDFNIYINGGANILGSKNRNEHMYKELNFLRLVFIYAMQNGLSKSFTLEDLNEWCDNTNEFKYPRDCYVSSSIDLIKLGSIKKTGPHTALRSILKDYIYS